MVGALRTEIVRCGTGAVCVEPYLLPLVRRRLSVNRLDESGWDSATLLNIVPMASRYPLNLGSKRCWFW